MDNFLVTKIVAKLGYYFMGLGTVILGAIFGVAMLKSFWGFVMGAGVGLFFAIPLLLACEFSYAIVKIADNTDPKNQQNNSFKNVA